MSTEKVGSTRNSVRAIGEPDEVFLIREVAKLLDDSQCVTLNWIPGITSDFKSILVPNVTCYL